MKLIYCQKCKSLTSLFAEKVRYCECKKCAGKYLADNMTSVINKEATLVGVDNNTFNIAVFMQEKALENPNRVDFFFSGWIPNKPGESITVDTIEDVKKHPYEEYHNVMSTMPNSEE